MRFGWLAAAAAMVMAVPANAAIRFVTFYGTGTVTKNELGRGPAAGAETFLTGRVYFGTGRDPGYDIPLLPDDYTGAVGFYFTDSRVRPAMYFEIGGLFKFDIGQDLSSVGYPGLAGGSVNFLGGIAQSVSFYADEDQHRNAFIRENTFGVADYVGFTGMLGPSAEGTWELANIRTITGDVPEPATWAMMIGGVGLVGGSLRRRAGRALRIAHAK